VNSASPWSGSGRRGPDPQCVAELHKVVRVIERSWTGPLFIGCSPTGQSDWAGRSQGRSRTAGGTSAIPPAEP